MDDVRVLRVGVPKEHFPGERRVAATPDSSKRLQKLGFEVLIEAGAGVDSDFPDERYAEAGCRLVPDRSELWASSDIILKVRQPNPDEIPLLRPEHTLISFIRPAQNPDLLEALRSTGATALAIDMVPRITRAQKMDALSSMANIAGYRAIVEAANLFPRFFTGQITAAGKIPPAKILVIGAGVAGLAAIGAGRALGAIVRAFDTRPVVKEQVQSMGAEFLEINIEESGEGEGGYAKEVSPAFIAAEMDLFMRQAKDVDIIVTTALIPGKPAPKLITREMVEAMREGSVVVDLASEMGGNCEMTVPGEVAVHHGVSIVGYTDLPSRMAAQSSQLYGTNLYHLLDDMGGAAKYRVDLNDEVVRGALVTREGQIMWPPPKPAAPAATPTTKPVIAPAAPAENVALHNPEKPHRGKGTGRWANSKAILWMAFGAFVLVGIGVSAPIAFLSHFTVFILACFVGWQVIWNVTPALHTPLMSVTNAISGIIIIGGMLQIGGVTTTTTEILSATAILLATINIAGGFLVTQRMLRMFRK